MKKIIINETLSDAAEHLKRKPWRALTKPGEVIRIAKVSPDDHTYGDVNLLRQEKTLRLTKKAEGKK